MSEVLSQRDFQRCHFEIGSGATLQPLLRFSDVTDEFVFVDYELSVDDAEDHLRAALSVFARRGEGQHAPLEMESLQRRDGLTMADFDLAMSPEEAVREWRGLLNQSEFREYQRHAAAAARAQQWGLDARIKRTIACVDGEAFSRVLRLRIVGGEGLGTYLAMGGRRHPPRQVSCVQTGLLDSSSGPLARLFRRQQAAGAALPAVWVRGTGWEPWWSRSVWRVVRGPERNTAAAYTPDVLLPAEPFSTPGQRYAHWLGDRTWPCAPDRRRLVSAWLSAAPVQAEFRIGPHVISAAPLEPSRAESFDTLSCTEHLAARLKLTGHPGLVLAEPPESDLLAPIAEQIRRWAGHDAFLGARHALFVPHGYEDEVAVIIRWLKGLETPAVTVALPMPLDFAAAVRAASAE